MYYCHLVATVSYCHWKLCLFLTHRKRQLSSFYRCVCLPLTITWAMLRGWADFCFVVWICALWPACEAVSHLYISIKPVYTYTLTLANAEEPTWVQTETFLSSLYLVFFASLKRLWQHAVVLICLRDLDPPLHFLCSLFQEEAFSFLGLSCIYLSCWCCLRRAFPSTMFFFIALFCFHRYVALTAHPVQMWFKEYDPGY